MNDWDISGKMLIEAARILRCNQLFVWGYNWHFSRTRDGMKNRFSPCETTRGDTESGWIQLVQNTTWVWQSFVPPSCDRGMMGGHLRSKFDQILGTLSSRHLAEKYPLFHRIRQGDPRKLAISQGPRCHSAWLDWACKSCIHILFPLFTREIPLDMQSRDCPERCVDLRRFNGTY